MAEDYRSGLNMLLGDLAKNDVRVPSPEEAINQQYDAPMEGPSTLSSMIQGLDSSGQQNITFDRMAQGQAASQLAADEYGKLDELKYGSAPDQQIVDPTSMIGSTGERVERGLKAGWGDLLYGTGETVDFINAWARPGDVEPSTSVGEWFQKIGTEYQNENALILSEDLKDITFQDMFKGEFWSSKISRLVPYAMSFVIPYGGGAKAGASLLGRFGVWSAKGISKANKAGKIGVNVGAMGGGIGMGANAVKGTGLLGKLATDAGRLGYGQTKLMRNVGGFIGGGAAANMAEGAYLSGEAYSEMLHEVDANGNKLFTPEEAANHAAGVMYDNAKWMAVDMVQYGLLFGGIGKNMAKRLLLNPLKSNPFKASIKGLTSYAVRKVLPNLPAAGAYASVEGITEGIQETYQEWIKYKNIQEAKGEDHLSMTDWVKDDYGNYRPEIRDLFWSSVGLGGAMGGARGYFDSAAARHAALDEHQEAINTNAKILDAAKTPEQYYAAEAMVTDNTMAINIWNYKGDGSFLYEYAENMVKDKKMSREVADEFIVAIEASEKNYLKHSANSMLTEAGAKQAFFRETRKSRNLSQQAIQKAAYETDKAHIVENIKNDKKQKKALEILEQNHLSIMETLDQDMAVLNREIEDIYTLRVDKAPIAESTGKRDARYKVQGLTKDEMKIYSQEESKKAEAEAKKKADAEPSLISKVVEGAKELGGKAVEGAKSLFGKAKDKVTSEETKKAIEDVKKYTKEEITPSAKEKLVKALEAGKIGVKAALKIIGSGVDKIINNKDVKEAIEKFKKAKKETVEAAEEKKQESDEDVKKKDQPQVVPKTEEYSKTEETLKKKGIQLEAASISKVVDKEGKASTTSYMLKTATGKVIKFFTSKPFGAEALTKTPQNIKLNLVEPVAGKADVVEVNGKLYFQHQKGAPLYESKIQVIVGDKVIGQLEYQEYKKDKGIVDSKFIDVESDTIGNLLKRIAEESDKSYFRNIARVLLGLNKKAFLDLVIKDGHVKGADQTVLGNTNKKQDNKGGVIYTISFSKENIKKFAEKTERSYDSVFAEVIMHETIHATTMNLLEIKKKAPQALKYLSKEETQFINEVEGLYSIYLSQSKSSRSRFKAVDNIHEFLTYSLTNPVFMGYLNKIKVEDSTILDKLYEYIAKLFGGDATAYKSMFASYAKYVKSGTPLETSKTLEGQKGPTKKAKKKDTRTIDKVIGSVKQTKESFKKLLDKSFKNIPAQEDILINRNLEVYTHSGLGAAALTRSIVQKQFPGARGYVISSKLADDYGQEATSLAIGSVVLINENQVEQTDLIHELGHVYYGLMEDTPLMKRIKKLLPKSAEYQRTKRNYPELILMNYNGNKMTLGSIYKNILINKPVGEEGILTNISENIALAERQGDSAKSTEFFNELRIQLKLQGIKDVRVDQQKHLLEETFTRTLELYSKGTVDSIVKGSEAQELLKKDLIEFYKKTKKLATDEEAKRLLDLSVDNIQSLDLEASIKHILLDFNSGERTIPVVQNSAYGDIKRANKKAFASRATYSAVSMYIGDFIGRNLTPTVMTNRVMKRIAEDSNLKVTDVKQLREYVKAIIVQITRPADLKLADKVLDKQLSEIGLDLNEKENMDQASESDQYKESNKIIALPTTTSNFIKKITEVYNFKNPDNIINRKKLLYDLYVIAKSTQNDPFDFIPTLRKSDSAEIMAMLRVLDGVYGKDKVLTNAKLMELKGPIEGINIEVLTQQALEIGYMGARKWRTYKTMSKTLEAGVINDVMNNLKENTAKGKRIAKIYDNLFYDSKENKFKEVLDENDINTAAKRVLSEILDDTNKGVLIDKDALLNARILFKDKRQTLSQILFGHTRFKNGKPNLNNQSLMGITKEGKFAVEIGKYQAKGLIYGKQGELKVILTEGLVASRAINYLSMVDNVEGDGISIFNKESGLHNRAKNVATIINNETIIESDSVMHPDNNIYADMAFRKKQAGVLANSEGKVTNNPFNFTIHSGMMRTLVTRADGVKYEGRASKLNSVTPSELIAGDFFSFLSKYNELMAGNEAMGIYDQAIAVFSDKSRRYYVESIIAHNDKMKKLLLSKIEKNPVYKKKVKYLNYEKALKSLNEQIKKEKISPAKAKNLRKNLELKYTIFPYTISNGKIKEMPAIIERWKEYANKNAELFKGNTDLKEVKNLDAALDAFLTSYIANKFMAQQLFVHDHRQSKDQIDYIKRAAGSIASHIVFDRNTQIEPIIIKDYFVDENNNIGTEEKEGTAIENDAMGYVLPEQAKYIRAKYGEVQKVGNVFKFVYHYTETEGKLKGNTTYLKFAVHTLTPKLESTSPYLKNIGDMLRKRQEQVQEMSKTPGNLVIAASESAAKLFFDGPSGKTGSKYVYDISTSENIDQIMASQDEIYKGDNGYQALSGEGLGIQLELDKQVSERFFPSQLFYNLATNIDTKEEQKIIEEMFILRQRVMEANNYSRNKAGEENGLIVDNTATEKQVLQERDGFKSSVSADIFGVLIDSVFPKVDPRYPFVNAVYNSIATGRITHKGTKMYTKGSIAYQSASLGMGLQSYKKGLFKGDENVIASEAIVPGYLQKQGVKKGDLFIGTRVPSHGKVTSSIFVVKDFHEQIGNSPTSNITIPAHVSKNWGADLDGDAVHMNFKWTNAEVKKKGKEWREFSNEFFDKYVQLISQPKRQAEIKADINFENDAKAAIAKAESVYGSKAKQEESQLTPMGDAQMFEDNVPAKNLVGIIAALQRTFNIFSNTEEKLPFSIKINNKTEDKFFDDSTLEGGVGNWFGVAQLLNIALDNAKHQFAGKLGIDMQSVFPYVTLRRLGYSLNDLSVLFNSPIVKEYMEFKRSRSKNYISKDSDIKEMFLEDQTINFNELVMFLEKRGIKGLTTKSNKPGQAYKRFYNEKNWQKLADRITKGIEIDLNALSKGDAKAEIDTILMLYGLNKYNQDIVRPFSKAFTVHQTIEKNPLELRKIRDDIARIQAGPVIINEKAKAGGLNISYTLGASSRNSIVQHAMGLFDSVLERAQRTDIRYTQYMRDIINDATFEELNKNKLTKPKIINQIIINNLKNKIEFLKPNALKDNPTLIEEFKLLQGRNKENKFLNRIIEVNEKGNKVVINRAEITEFTSYKAIEQIKESFNQLTETEKDFVFALEAQFNGFGLTGGAGAAGSFIPFFDDVYIEKINKSMSAIIEENQTREANLVGSLATEYTDARSMLGLGGIISGNQKYSTEDKVDIASKLDNSFVDPTRKAKKIISSETSYNNDYLGSGVRMLEMDTWARDKGIDLSKISPESDTFTILRNRYDTYREQYRLVKEFEAKLERKPLSKYEINDLYELGVKFRKMDNSATKGIAHTIEKEIGQRAFRIQSEKLRKKGARQGYEYNTPGVDGVAQEDISNFQKWLGSNDMTSKRPEIQYLINEVQEEYRKYLRSFSKYKNMIESSNKSLIRSKMRSLSILERVRKGFDVDARYKFIYGNIATLENGNIRLLSEEEINQKELTEEERNYYNAYKKIGNDLLNVQDVIVPGMQMGNIESMSRSGLFGLYNATIDSSDYNRVKVKGTDQNGDKVYKTFYEWKYDVYKGRTGDITLKSGKKINELEKLRKLAKDWKSRGKHMDGSNILLSDSEYDALINNGSRLKRMMGDGDTINNIDAELIQEYERRRGVKAATISYDIHSGMLEFVRSSLFMHGENLQKNPDGFSGMNKMSVLTDSIISFNKNLDNKKAVDYLTKWWKEGFLEKKQQEGVFGKTGDKIIDSFVRLTSLRLLGFNMGIGVGNILAGKYQELRKRGGKQFILGEKRYWIDGKDKSWDLLKKHRIVEYSFDEFIHLSERKGLYGKIERWSYYFMDRSESYIQGAAFLGELTEREYNGLDPIDDQRVMQINHKISTLHGEGYTALDASMLSMYSYGRALLQFKKWFITTLRDRFKAEDIDRFGNVNIGSYRASSEFVVNLFRKYFAGEMTKKNIMDIFNESSPQRKQEIINHLNGIGIGITLLSLIALMEDDDETDSNTLRTMKKFSHDVFVTTDMNRFVNYTLKPSSYSTLRNSTKAIGEAIRGDKIKRSSAYGEKGESQAIKTLFHDVAPLAEVRKDISNIFYKGEKGEKETSSLIR